MARVSQLTERTNQFNFTTIRRSEREIEQLCESGAACLVVNLADRFGDYGLVGVTIAAAKEKALEVDTFLLSCRALGRKVEHRMLAKLGELAHERGRRPSAGFFCAIEKEPAGAGLSRIGRRAVSRANAQSQLSIGFPRNMR